MNSVPNGGLPHQPPAEGISPPIANVVLHSLWIGPVLAFAALMVSAIGSLFVNPVFFMVGIPVLLVGSLVWIPTTMGVSALVSLTAAAICRFFIRRNVNVSASSWVAAAVAALLVVGMFFSTGIRFGSLWENLYILGAWTIGALATRLCLYIAYRQFQNKLRDQRQTPPG